MGQRSKHVTEKGHGLGYRRDLPDHRDLYFAAEAVQVPTKVDLTSGMGAIRDQGQLGSCTANAIGAAYEFEQKKQNLKSFEPSRLAIYYNERVLEHSVEQDSGAQIRDGIKTINSQGVCPETDWPYDISKFAQKPPQKCYDEGKEYHAVKYRRVRQNLGAMKACLAAGYPFVFGFTVYESFESSQVAKTGIVPMPSTRERILGGHAVYAVAYDDSTQRFTVPNSWGLNWGKLGLCYMPYSYLTDSNLAADFWQISLVSG